MIANSKLTEHVNAIDASRPSQAHIAAIEIAKEMGRLGMRILACRPG